MRSIGLVLGKRTNDGFLLFLCSVDGLVGFDKNGG